MIEKFRKKPVVIEAVLFTGDNSEEIEKFTKGLAAHPCAYENGWRKKGDALVISTLEGMMICDKGDYVIKGVKGEFYPCKPDIFKATYDPVTATYDPEKASRDKIVSGLIAFKNAGYNAMDEWNYIDQAISFLSSQNGVCK